MATEQEQLKDQPAGDNRGGDFMMNTLNEFNKGPHDGSPDQESQAEEQKTVDESVETQPQITPQEKEGWLIENKFRNDDEGRSKLAESYRSLQGEKDKLTNEYQEKDEKYKQLDQLDSYLRANPEVVADLRGNIEEKSNQYKPPVKPDEYDPYEESVEGSESFKYRQAYDKYLVQQGANEARKELDGFRQEMQAKEAVEAEQQVLKNLGLEDSEIQEYRDFINDPNVVTPENLVNIWRMMSQQKDNRNTAPGKSPETQSEGSSGRTSLASVSGVTPSPLKSSTKEANEFMDDIMQFSNNYTPDRK
tara:strand:+ start:1498 stop:2412 length:915 start_codon:yes stop_codon:yes gene_type:complete